MIGRAHAITSRTHEREHTHTYASQSHQHTCTLHNTRLSPDRDEGMNARQQQHTAKHLHHKLAPAHVCSKHARTLVVSCKHAYTSASSRTSETYTFKSPASVELSHTKTQHARKPAFRSRDAGADQHHWLRLWRGKSARHLQDGQIQVISGSIEEKVLCLWRGQASYMTLY